MPMLQGATGGQGRTMGARVVPEPEAPSSAPRGLGSREEAPPYPATMDTAPVREGGAPRDPRGPRRRAPLRLGLVGLRGRARVMAPDMGHGPKPHGAEARPSPIQAAPTEGVKATRIATEGLRGTVATARALLMVAPAPSVPHKATRKKRLPSGDVEPNDELRAARLTS